MVECGLAGGCSAGAVGSAGRPANIVETEWDVILTDAIGDTFGIVTARSAAIQRLIVSPPPTRIFAAAVSMTRA